MVATAIIILLYISYSTIASVSRGYLNQAGVIYVLFVGITLVILGALLWSAGFFDPMLDRFDNDYGSALSRDYALEILQNASTSALWFGFTSQNSIASAKLGFNSHRDCLGELYPRGWANYDNSFVYNLLPILVSQPS